MTTVSVVLPASLHNEARRPADNEQISLDELIRLALAEKVSALATEDYLRERAGRADQGKYLEALEQVPDVEPEERDRT
jgi:hypothetical protein